MLSDVVGERVARLRRAAGLTQEGLAERCADMGWPELTTGVIGSVETGRPARKGGPRTREVSVDELVALAMALDVPPVLLLADPREHDSAPLTAGREVDSWELLLWLVGAAAPGPDGEHHSYRRASAVVAQGWRIAEQLPVLRRPPERGFRRTPDGSLCHTADGALINDPEDAHRQTNARDRLALETIRTALLRLEGVGARLPQLGAHALRRAADLGVDLPGQKAQGPE